MTDVTAEPRSRPEVATPNENRPLPARLLAADETTPLSVCLFAAALCLAVGLIHIQDQGGFLGNVMPAWIAVGYYVVEIVSAISAFFLARQQIMGWILGLAVSVGPAGSYILSRSVGLPGDPGDIGNWGYTLGAVSLIVEGLLFALCMLALVRARAAMSSGTADTQW